MYLFRILWSRLWKEFDFSVWTFGIFGPNFQLVIGIFFKLNFRDEWLARRSVPYQGMLPTNTSSPLGSHGSPTQPAVEGLLWMRRMMIMMKAFLWHQNVFWFRLDLAYFQFTMIKFPTISSFICHVFNWKISSFTFGDFFFKSGKGNLCIFSSLKFWYLKLEKRWVSYLGVSPIGFFFFIR